MFTMNDLDAYRTYLAFKLHFTTDNYDITKTRGAVTASKESFLKRKDQFAFKKLADEFDDEELPKFLIANYVDGNRWGGTFIYEQAVQVYHKWKGRIQSLTKNFENDLDKIALELSEENVDMFDKAFVVKDEQHPILLRMYSRGEVAIESMIILDGLNKFISYWDKTLSTDYYWLQERRKIVKYRPFIAFDVDKCKAIMHNRKTLYDENRC